MKLTANEVKLLSNVARRRQQHRLDAWTALLLAAFSLVLTEGFGLLPSLRETGLQGLIFGLLVAHLIHVYFTVRPSDKLIDLLQRYVNEDAEAITQLHGTNPSGEVSA